MLNFRKPLLAALALVWMTAPAICQLPGPPPSVPIYDPVGSANLATSQASITTGAAQSIVAARTGAVGTGRIAVTLYNAGTATVYVGPASVTTSTGLPLLAGAALTLNTTAALYGIAVSGTQTIGIVETY